MDDSTVDEYMSWFDQINARWFYSLNYLGQPMSLLHESSNFFSPRPSKNWIVRYEKFNPAFIVLQSPRNLAEYFFEKIDDKKLNRELAQAKRIIAENQPADLENWITVVDALRQTDDLNFILSMIRKYMKLDLKAPKELVYFTRKLIKEKNRLDSCQRVALEKIYYQQNRKIESLVSDILHE